MSASPARSRLQGEIPAKHGDRLKAFYEDHLSWSIKGGNEFNCGLVDSGHEGGISGGLFEHDEGASAILDIGGR